MDTIKKYRKKPVVITAWQTSDSLDIKTLEGEMHASPGDWIITGVNGEQYPCKPDIFAKTYEPADLEPTPDAQGYKPSAYELAEILLQIPSKPGTSGIFDLEAMAARIQQDRARLLDEAAERGKVAAFLWLEGWWNKYCKVFVVPVGMEVSVDYVDFHRKIDAAIKGAAHE